MLSAFSEETPSLTRMRNIKLFKMFDNAYMSDLQKTIEKKCKFSLNYKACNPTLSSQFLHDNDCIEIMQPNTNSTMEMC